jgi:FlaA1/EpsC-like NDP-sugar epimerase
MTKALQERLFVNANSSNANRGTCFACVRYGNVIGSRGSVVPLFKSQIQAGGPVTITHPEMTRYLITLPEAINLVFKAAREAHGGEIFVPNVPSARVLELAEVMVECLAGDSQIKIDYVGVRPGEKIHEVLISEEESWRSLANGECFMVLPVGKWRSLRSTFPNYHASPHVEYTSNSGTRLDKAALRRLLVQEKWC